MTRARRLRTASSTPCGRQQQGQDRQPEPDELEQSVDLLGLADGVGGQHGEVRVHLGDLRGEGEPLVDERLLDLVDDGGEVDDHGVVGELHRSAAASGQRLVHGGVRSPVQLGPQGGERVAADEPQRHGVHEVGEAAGDRTAQRADRLGQYGPVGGGDGFEQRLDVDVLHHRVGHPLGDGVLDVRVGGERLHGGHVPVGVADQIARPGRHGTQRGEEGGEEDQHDSEGRPDAVVLASRLAPLQFGDPGPQFGELPPVRAALMRHRSRRRSRLRCSRRLRIVDGARGAAGGHARSRPVDHVVHGVSRSARSGSWVRRHWDGPLLGGARPGGGPEEGRVSADGRAGTWPAPR